MCVIKRNSSRRESSGKVTGIDQAQSVLEKKCLKNRQKVPTAKVIGKREGAQDGL